MAEPLTSVSFKQAKFTSLKVRKGMIYGVFEAPVGEGDATIADFATLTSDTFQGTVSVKGREQQTALVFDPPKPGDSKE